MSSPQASAEGDAVRVGVWWAVTINTTDPRRLAGFWSAVLGSPVIEPGPDRPGWLRIEHVAANGPVINFQPLERPPERKSETVHLDVFVERLDVAIERVVALGGSDTGRRETLPRGRIAVVRDPDGNDFCLLAAPTDELAGS